MLLAVYWQDNEAKQLGRPYSCIKFAEQRTHSGTFHFHDQITNSSSLSFLIAVVERIVQITREINSGLRTN